jgi:hypothetical protein
VFVSVTYLLYEWRDWANVVVADPPPNSTREVFYIGWTKCTIDVKQDNVNM